ncbi:hypothetical protein JIG36_09450 [Actinoplanes sp. LDG1-06]|uniref:Uncharacterized protein n=1 Tax=Paractinoplanes ovalisporus TaxID=2810368 RepID=A0ABS2A7G6_9ACTN|nr:hypothetical protein [Actinoplanes ovalisporus]MBM2615779.1 hypothetical protein [Actinoplanes ovalisporus]
MRTCQLFEARDLAEIWRLAWSRAITRTAVAHILLRPGLSRRVDPATARALKQYGTLVPLRRTPGTVYSHLAELLWDNDTRQQLTGYLRDGAWTDVNHYLREASPALPPMAFYVDGMDEFFEAAPSYWLPCQEGLFHAVMQWLRDPAIGGRLHVVVAIRDVVLSSILRGEMAGKFRGDPHLRVLDWDAGSLTYLLDRKIEKLDERYLARPDSAGDPVERWLGLSDIDNVARGTSERMPDYLLRHIRLVPRDLVELGNSLCAAVREAKEDRQVPSPEVIRGTIAAKARTFGAEQIQQCANQISADMAPAGRPGGHVLLSDGRHQRPPPADVRVGVCPAPVPHRRRRRPRRRRHAGAAALVGPGWPGSAGCAMTAGPTSSGTCWSSCSPTGSTAVASICSAGCAHRSGVWNRLSTAPSATSPPSVVPPGSTR